MRARRSLRIVRLALAVVAAMALLAGGVRHASAQEPFRVAYAQEQQPGGPTVITGTVQNDARQDAHDVYVTAEALNAGGKVVARGIAFVANVIPAGRAAGFTAKVPAMPGVTRVRVGVTSYRLGLTAGGQSP